MKVLEADEAWRPEFFFLVTRCGDIPLKQDGSSSDYQ
jgi:hypothetical protein